MADLFFDAFLSEINTENKVKFSVTKDQSIADKGDTKENKLMVFLR